MRGSFGFVQDDGGTYYVAVNNEQNQITLVQSANQGTSWHLSQAVPIPAGAGSVFFPTLASDSADRIGLTYYASDPADGTRVGVQFVGSTRASDVTLPPGSDTTMLFQGPTLVSSIFHVGFLNIHQLGDYMGMAVVPANTCMNPASFYIPAWTDISRINTGVDRTDIAATIVEMTP
jgi:hypothetical protein